MLNHEPKETTALLIDHCCGRLPIAESAQLPSTDGQSNGTASGVHTSSPAYLNVFNSSLQLGRTAVEAAAAATAAVLPGGSTSAAPPVVNGGGPSNGKGKSSDETASKHSDFLPEVSSPSPSPTPFFAQFVNHPAEFLLFLESVALVRWGQKVDVGKSSSAKGKGVAPPAYEESTSSVATDSDLQDQRAMWNTVLELSLSFASNASLSPAERDVHRAKALGLINQSDQIPYNPTHALILCSINGFTDGLVVLWEEMGMYEDVLRFWMEKEKQTDDGSSTGTALADRRRPSEEVMKQLRRYGSSHPYLYPLVLRFLTSSNELLTRHQKDLVYVLDVIDRERIMPALQVVQVLSRNGVASIGVVKEWLTRKVSSMRVEIDSVSSSPSSFPWSAKNESSVTNVAFLFCRTERSSTRTAQRRPLVKPRSTP